MDFLKTLMLYMTMTFATSVQGAPTPAVTPEPTPAPTVVATVLPGVETTAEAEATLTPAPAGATAVPRVTPTPNKAYKILRKGDRGDNVKKMQERLIELGYLTGKADGAYGNQTRKAVMLFQSANGLTRDGVAGPATLTILYEDPNAAFNPDFVTPTPVPGPTATVTPEPAEATIAPPVETPVPAPVLQEGVTVSLNGEELVCLRQEDGITTSAAPRVYQDADGFFHILLNDLCAAVPGWSLSTDDLGDVIFAFDASEAMISEHNGEFSASVNGQELTLEEGEVQMLQGKMLCRVTFLEKAMGATVLFSEDDDALTITRP